LHLKLRMAVNSKSSYDRLTVAVLDIARSVSGGDR